MSNKQSVEKKEAKKKDDDASSACMRARATRTAANPGTHALDAAGNFATQRILYLRIITQPPFDLTYPDDEERAEGTYTPEGDIEIPPNLVVLDPGGHKVRHRVLESQPAGPSPGQGPGPQTPDGTSFCVLDLVGDIK